MPRKPKSPAARLDLIDLPIRNQTLRLPSRIPASAARRGLDLPYYSQLMMGAGAHRNDCGPACVRMALDFLGLAPGVSIDQMAIDIDSDDDGTTPNDLVRLAASYGASANVQTLALGVMPTTPAILLVRYPGFKRESVENKGYWDAATVTPKMWHWLWWLGNRVIDGQVMSVWNDPLYVAGSGKNVLHTIDELRAAFLPYGDACIAITFAGITGTTLPAPGGTAGSTLEVVTIDEGVRLRSQPSTQSDATILAELPRGTRLSVLEDANSALIKMSGGNYWLRVRTTVNGVGMQGFIAAWLVTAAAAGPLPEPSAPSPTVPQPTPSPGSLTWQDVINAAYVMCHQAQIDFDTTMNNAGIWRIFDDSLRKLPYTGPNIGGWPIAPELRQKMAELLALGSAGLVALTMQTAGDVEAQKRATAAARPSLIGIHGPPGIGCPPRADQTRWIKTLQSMGVCWYKQCDDGDPNHREIFEWCKRLKQAGIEPIIRYFCDHQFPNPLPDHYFEKMKLYAEADIAWAEIGNEPNLDYEWQNEWNGRVDYNNPELIRLLCEGWVRDAQRAVVAGVRPAFYALGPTDWNNGSHPQLSSVYFASRMALYLAEHRRAETMALFQQGAWFAVHSATFEQPDDFEPFRANGIIWDQTLRGYEIVRKCFHDAFGATLNVAEIPIASTEGGVFTPESTSMGGGHTRLNSDAEHAQRIVNMFQWLEQHSPLMAMCPWCLSAVGFGGPFDAHFSGDGWFKLQGDALTPRPVVAAMQLMKASRVVDGVATRGLGPHKPNAAVNLNVTRELIHLGIAEDVRLQNTPARKTRAKTKAAGTATKPKRRISPKAKRAQSKAAKRKTTAHDQ